MEAAGLVAAVSECLRVFQLYRRPHCALEAEYVACIGNDYSLSIISRRHT
jgi:hypothetical protein